MLARGKNIYNLIMIIKVNKLFSFFTLRCILLTNRFHVAVHLSSNRSQFNKAISALNSYSGVAKIKSRNCNRQFRVLCLSFINKIECNPPVSRITLQEYHISNAKIGYTRISYTGACVAKAQIKTVYRHMAKKLNCLMTRLHVLRCHRGSPGSVCKGVFT